MTISNSNPNTQNNLDFNSAFKPLTNMDNKKKFAILSAASMPFVILILVLVVLLAGLGYLYSDSQKENEELRKRDVLGQSTEEYQEVLNNVKSLIKVADDERVNIARIDNVDELKKQNPEFYKDIVQGQYLIVMPTSQRVLVYDKGTNKIVNFSSYTISVEKIKEEEIEAKEKPLTIELRVSASVDTKTINDIKDALAKASPNYKVLSTTPLTNDNQTGLSVVLLNRAAKPKMSQNIIADVGTNSITEKMPEGEPDSTADVVIIIGKINTTN